MEKNVLIKIICELLLKDDKDKCIDLALNNYPFTETVYDKRQYSKCQMCCIFLRDGFIDRYSGQKLLFPGIIKILSIEFPEIFKYHKNWKMSETHLIYWELFPTIDHIIPIARGGADNENNWVTTSMIRNSAKSNWTLEEVNWFLHPKGNIKDWDGLSKYFLELIKKNPEYRKDKYVSEWERALLNANDNFMKGQ